MDRQQHTDEELLTRYRKTNDNRWIGILLEQYTVLLLGVGIKYLKDKERAADAVQQVFLKALTAIPENEIKNFKGWLYILMRNHCFQLLRDKKYMAGDDVLQAQEAYDEPDINELISQEQEIKKMKDAIQQLDENQQYCITAFYLRRKSYQEIIDEKGYTFMQVKSYIQNGKRRLKTILTAQRQDDKK